MRANRPGTRILNSSNLAIATLLLSVISAVAIPSGKAAAIPNPKGESQNRLAQAQTAPERRAEAIRLNDEGLQLSSRGQFREALEKLQQSLILFRELADRASEGTTLNNLGLVHTYLGQYQKAIEYYQQALAIRLEVGDRAGEGITLNGLGLVYTYLGQYAKALEYYQQALAIRIEVGNRAGEGTTLNNLGGVYESMGQYAKALEYYQQARAIRIEVGDRAGEGTTLDNLGAVYNSLGEYTTAIEYHQQARAIRIEVGDRAGEGTTLNNLGLVYDNLGQSSKALESYQQALAIYIEVGNKAGVGTVLSNLGGVYDSLGEYPKAIEYHQQALAIHQEVGNRPMEGTTFMSLGNVYNALGEYPKALEFYQQARAIAQEVGNKAEEGTALNNLGNLYFNLGQFPKALEYYEQARAIAQATGEKAKEGTTLNNLGAVYFAQRQYQDAIASYQKALAIHREVGNRPMEGTTLNNLGIVYASQGQYQDAIEAYQQALTIRIEVGDKVGIGKTFNNLGNVYFDRGQYPTAIEHYQQARAIAQEVGNKAGEGTILTALGAVYANQEQYAEAEKNLYAAIEVWESLRPSELADADKISLFETQAFTYSWLQHALIAQNKINAALEVSERGRARAFVELLAKQLNPRSETPPKIKPPSIAEIQQTAKDHNATLVQYSVLPHTLLIWVIQPTGKIDLRAVDLKKLDGSLTDLSNLARLEAANARSADNPSEFTSLIRGTQESLRNIVTVRPTNDANNSTNRLKQLHQILIAPIADLLPTNPEDRVIFIPHQSLFYIPFPALTDENDQYLIKQHTILTAPSIQVLQLTREHRQRVGTLNLTSLRGNNALIVGNPVMPWIPDKNGNLFQLTNLPGAEREATEIAQMLDTEPLLGAQATESAVVQRMKTARLIHFATHGLLQDFGYGIPGAIALSPSQGDGGTGRRGDGGIIGADRSDGLLTSGEIVQLTNNNPLNAELVVLSACETGLGDLSGDGVIGLSRSLIAAGVPSMVVSLWNVPDDATRELMKEFYTNLYEKKMDKAQALRQAMLTLLNGDRADPKDWSAFTLIGEAE